MTLNTFKCNYLTPLHFKGLTFGADNVKDGWVTIICFKHC